MCGVAVTIVINNKRLVVGTMFPTPTTIKNNIAQRVKDKWQSLRDIPKKLAFNLAMAFVPMPAV